MRKIHILVALYALSLVLLFLYSFTQVDLGLTLTRLSIWQGIQTTFQHIGYFDRPLSTYFYSGILVLLSIFYFLFLWLVHVQKINKRQMWILVFLCAFVLALSYNAFSYDLFNYVFDAKIVTHYGQNPFEHKALDFPGDPMLSFMHWTHRVYPYGWSWLIVTVPLSYIGMQLLLPTLILFKLLMTACYIGTSFFIYKISEKLFPKYAIFNTLFFALNPFVLIESLVSAHNEIVMMFFAMWALYLFVQKKYVFSIIVLIFSIGVKFATAFVLPVLAIVFAFQFAKKKIDWEKAFVALAIVMIVAVVLASLRTNFQPWYLLYVLPFAALVAWKPYILVPSITISIGALLQYIPFLYSGNWDAPIPTILFWIMTGSIVLSAVITLFIQIGSYRKK